MRVDLGSAVARCAVTEGDVAEVVGLALAGYNPADIPTLCDCSTVLNRRHRFLDCPTQTTLRVYRSASTAVSIM